ncbi:MAG: 4-hydroxybenzoate octaprenyltransferase [Pseudomarimonas sp.]
MKPPRLYSLSHWQQRLSAALPPALRDRFDAYWRLVRGDRPIGWLLLLWPTWWGLWLAAEGTPPLSILGIFTAGVWLMRAAGCIINDHADRWLDPHVERTRARPLASGEVSSREALWLFVILCAVAFGLVMLCNWLTVQLSVVGVLLAASYPYLKRYTWFPQVYLGIAFGWAIPMAFAAVQGKVPELAWLAFVATVLWATAYDTWYAMVDREDDIRMGARSTAILFGELDLLMQAVLFSSVLIVLGLLGSRAQLGSIYFIAMVAAAGLIGWQFWLARSRTREGCFAAFRNNQWVGMLVFFGIALGYAWR